MYDNLNKNCSLELIKKSNSMLNTDAQNSLIFKWSGTRDSNSQPHAPKACALANCASPRESLITYGGKL